MVNTTFRYEYAMHFKQKIIFLLTNCLIIVYELIENKFKIFKYICTYFLHVLEIHTPVINRGVKNGHSSNHCFTPFVYNIIEGLEYAKKSFSSYYYLITAYLIVSILTPHFYPYDN